MINYENICKTLIHETLPFKNNISILNTNYIRDESKG